MKKIIILLLTLILCLSSISCGSAAGKKEDALRVLEEARGPEQDFYFDISAIADTNMRKIRQNWGLPLKLYREFDSCSEPVVYMEEMMDAYFDLKETE